MEKKKSLLPHHEQNYREGIIRHKIVRFDWAFYLIEKQNEEKKPPNQFYAAENTCSNADFFKSVYSVQTL